MIIEFLTNTLLISIPEESFIVAFVLIFMGRIEYLNLKKSNVVKFLLPVTLTAFTTGFIRIILQFSLDFMLVLLSVLIIFGSVTILYKIRSFKKIMQCLACTILGLLIPGLVQLLYVPVVMNIMRLTIDDINKVNFGVICFTIPERVIEILIIAILFAKKKNLMKVNPFRIIMNNKLMSAVFFVSLILNLIFIYVFTYQIYIERILAKLPILVQILAAMLIIVMPIINMSSIVAVVYTLALREKSKRMYIVQETKAVSALISVLSRRGNYTQIQDELKDFNQQIQEIDKKK